MKYIRFRFEDTVSYGQVDGDLVRELTNAPYLGADETGRSFSLNSVELLAPVDPEKIVGVGLNFMDHITSQGLSVPVEPYIVHRPRNTLNAHDATVYIRPEHVAQFEGELVIVIGRKCKNVTPAEAGNYIFGYTIGNDVTEKDFFQRDKHFGVAKSFDGQCPIGPWIVTDYDYRSKNIRTVINGTERQNGSTDSMVFDCETLVSYLSGFMTLMPGDVILSGSPAGVGRLSDGDTVEITVEGIGTLSNHMKDIVNSAKSEG